MKNKGYIFFIVLMNLLSSCRISNKVFIFGELNNDIKLLLDNSSDKKINYVFTSSKMYSNHIYKMVSNNSYIYIF